MGTGGAFGAAAGAAAAPAGGCGSAAGVCPKHAQQINSVKMANGSFFIDASPFPNSVFEICAIQHADDAEQTHGEADHDDHQPTAYARRDTQTKDGDKKSK